MTHDIKGLEAKTRRVQDSLAKLHNAKHADRFIPIIHRGGWTTIAEFELVNAYVDNMERQLASVQQSFEFLIQVAGKIGQ